MEEEFKFEGIDQSSSDEDEEQQELQREQELKSMSSVELHVLQNEI